jgi:hypothetical protein
MFSHTMTRRLSVVPLLVALGPLGLAPPVARAAPASPTPAATSATPPLTAEQALARARTTGAAVPVPGATTATDTLTADPDGTLTVTEAAQPVRKQVGGTWTALDATLTTNPDHTLSPAVSTGGLTLSGGGSGPLATLTAPGATLALSLPVTLPTPTLTGPTATYANVLPGVNLQVTANEQGGFREVLVVHDATAAANPALRSLTLATQARGISLGADGAGNLAASTPGGRVVFTAPAPRMWDSTAPTLATTIADPDTGRRLDPTTSAPVDSSADGPGEDAHSAAIGVATGADGITLTPDQALLTDAGTVYPVYLDPTWSTVNPARGGWATVAEYFPGSNYWNNTPDPDGEMQVGNSGEMWSHTLMNFPISGVLGGATIHSAQLNIFETHSFSCTASRLDLYAPATTLSAGNATWNFWHGVGLGTRVAEVNVAHGYTGCAGAGVGFDATTGVVAAVAAHRGTQTFLLQGVNESSDHNSWKEFRTSSPTLSITYDHPPSVPTGLTTSPATACAAATPTTVGDASVSLYAPVSDPDGGSLGVSFQLWKTSTPGTILASSGPSLTYTSGTTAVLVVPLATLSAAAGSAVTEFSWHVQVSDVAFTSAPSATCNFNFDPTRPGQPTVTGSTDGATMGTPLSFTVTAPPTGTVPTSYLYQLNGAAPRSVPATAGSATITVTPPRFTNTLTVSSLSAGGNVGDAAAVTFNATPRATPQPDQDLSGDNISDVLTVGGQNTLPAGLWLAAGHAGAGQGAGTGQVLPTAVNLGAHGNGVAGDGLPADFTGSRAITGHFTGTGLQDVLAYYPSGPNAGGAQILNGNGDGSVLQAQLSGNEHTLSSGILTDANGDNPSQLVNAYDSTGQGYAYPDLLGVSGDGTAGHYLAYYPNGDSLGAYGQVDQLDTVSPDGTMDWDSWAISTCSVAGGTAMYLWNHTTGALYLWTDVRHDLGSSTLSFTPHTLANGTGSTWMAGHTFTTQASDINNDGTPDLWVVGTTGTGTAFLVGDLSGTATIAEQPAVHLVTSTHDWPLNDGTSGPASAAADTTGTLPATGTGAVSWHTGDLFGTDAAFTGQAGGLSTTGQAVPTNADFTISAWVKANATGGYVLSQDGAHSSGFVLYPDTASGRWTFGLSTSDAAAPVYDNAGGSGTTVHLGVWTHLTATYHKATGRMALYVDGIDGTTGTHTVTWNAVGPFQIGQRQLNGAHTGFFNGQIADVQVWNQALTPVEAAQLSGTPGYVMFGSDGTVYASRQPGEPDVGTGLSWVTAGARMTFDAGLLTITQTGTGTLTRTFGANRHPDAVFTVQTDGNVVIYPTAARTPGTALWSPNTYPHPGDVAFLQPDGNFVVYDVDGTPLWDSQTYN